MAENFHYGGQAIIEGVMIRGRKSIVTAVRHPSKGLTVATHPLPTAYTGRVRKIPVLRGVVILVETLFLGAKTMFYSANVSLEEEGEKISGRMVGAIVAVSLVSGVALFFLAPLFLAKLLDPHITSPLLFNLIEGGFRLAIFLIYLKAITLLPDVKRVFAYHGAEHKAINAYEDAAPLEVEAARKYGTAHVRCGTNFMFSVLIIAIFVFALVGSQPIWLMALSRILLIPVIAGVAYEITHFNARHTRSSLVRAALTPGLRLQSLTAKAPDDSQLEVALSALKKAVELDHPEETAQVASG